MITRFLKNLPLLMNISKKPGSSWLCVAYSCVRSSIHVICSSVYMFRSRRRRSWLSLQNQNKRSSCDAVLIPLFRCLRLYLSKGITSTYLGSKCVFLRVSTPSSSMCTTHANPSFATFSTASSVRPYNSPWYAYVCRNLPYSAIS